MIMHAGTDESSHARSTVKLPLDKATCPLGCIPLRIPGQWGIEGTQGRIEIDYRIGDVIVGH
jgi:hypothetical protein